MVEVGIGSFKTVGFSAVDMQGLASSWKAGATLYGIKHILRNSANFGKKHVILTDSMTPAVAFDKARACSHRLRRVIQQAAALSLGSGCFFRSWWVPSEWNPADGPSRGSRFCHQLL